MSVLGASRSCQRYWAEDGHDPQRPGCLRRTPTARKQLLRPGAEIRSATSTCALTPICPQLSTFVLYCQFKHSNLLQCVKAAPNETFSQVGRKQIPNHREDQGCNT